MAADRNEAETTTPPPPQRVALLGHSGAVLAACFAGRYVLTAGADKSVRLFNPFRDHADAKEREVAAFSGPHGYALVDVAVSDDSEVMACCGDDKCGFVWNVEAQQVVQRLYGHSGALTSTRFAPSNNLVVTGSKDCSVRVYDLRSRNPAGIMTLRGFKDTVSAVHMTQGEILAASVDGAVRTFDVRQGSVATDRIEQSSGPAALASLDVLRDGSQALVGCVSPGQLCLMDRASAQVTAVFRGHENASARIPARIFGSRDGDDYACTGSERGELWLWKLVASTAGKGKEDAGPAVRAKFHDGALSALACSSHSHGLVLTAGYDGAVLLHADVIHSKA